MKNEKMYCVANVDGDLVAHDVRSYYEADCICGIMQKKEPEAEWEVIEQ